MDPQGIALVFIFMVVAVVLGVYLSVVGTVRLRQLARGDSGGHNADTSKAWERTILVGGLLFIACGLYGILRLIFGS
jgi:hypothetical protein